MSGGLNRATIIGHLGHDPELHRTQAEIAVMSLRIASTESIRGAEGERRDHTEWHRVVVWGKRAEALAKILKKGALIYVEGPLRTREYERDGAKRYTTEIVADEIVLAGART